jgi:Nuclease-related domain
LQIADTLTDTESIMDAQAPDPGAAGRSARCEAERSRERRQLSRPPRPRLLSALLGPSAEEKRLLAREKRWATGARGEEMVAEALARRCQDVPLLHDRRMPRSRANIDHIAVAASGVYVIDAKRYRGKIEVRRPLFAAPKLKIAGRDQTKLVDGLAKQLAAVEAALADLAPEVPVRGCFCFVAPEGFLADSGLPVLRTLEINGYRLYYPRRLAKRLNSSGPLTTAWARDLHAALAERSLRPSEATAPGLVFPRRRIRVMLSRTVRRDGAKLLACIAAAVFAAGCGATTAAKHLPQGAVMGRGATLAGPRFIATVYRGEQPPQGVPTVCAGRQHRRGS